MENTEFIAIAQHVIWYLNEKTGKKFNAKAIGNIIKVIARLKEGYTEADCKQVVDNMVYHWGKDVKMSAYLRPSTLFNNGTAKRQFESYLNMSIPEQKKPTGQDSELSDLLAI